MLGYIRKHDLLRAGDNVGVAVSGGADSVALLRLMLEVRDELGVLVSVVHLNHKLRGVDTDADEQFVRELAATHGLEITSESCDVRAYAAAKKLSLETAARELRYEFFRCLQSHLNRIATAHTMDDQAETVLLKLTRGAGTRGLAGIYPRLAVSREPSAASKTDRQRVVRDEPFIVRPLLETRGSQARYYLTEIGQKWREDVTNQDPRYTRNRVRHQILPFLEKEINSSLCRVLADTAEIARGEEDYWVGEMQRVLPQVWRQREQGGTMNSAALRTFPLAVQRRLVRTATESLNLGLEFRHVEEILRLQDEGDCTVLPNCWHASVRRGQIEFHHSPEQATAIDYMYQLPLPGRIAVPEAGIEIEAFLCSGEDEAQRCSAEHLLGHAFIQRGLVVRNWRAGERFWAAHSKEPKKIKELLQDRHITGEQKKSWPVVASGDEIVWLRGFGVRCGSQSKNGRGILIREADGVQNSPEDPRK